VAEIVTAFLSGVVVGFLVWELRRRIKAGGHRNPIMMRFIIPKKGLVLELEGISDKAPSDPYWHEKYWRPVTLEPEGDASFSGSVDEVMLLNRALSEDEVKRLYEATKPRKPEKRGEKKEETLQP